MSISSLTNAALARRPDFGAKAEPPENLRELAAAAAPPPVRTRKAGVEPRPANGSSAQPASDALQVIASYIPTEIITLYVAVSAALPAITDPDSVRPSHWITLGVFLFATPLVVWIAFAVKVVGASKPMPITYSEWPKWEMIAATVAFAAWAIGLPASPFIEFPWYSKGIAGVAVLVTSTALGLVSPLFQRPLAAR